MPPCYPTPGVTLGRAWNDSKRGGQGFFCLLYSCPVCWADLLQNLDLGTMSVSCQTTPTAVRRGFTACYLPVNHAARDRNGFAR
jgi:hypothetical protein